MDRKKFLEEKTKEQSNKIALVLTYNRISPNVKWAITNNCNVLNINQEFKDSFVNGNYKKLSNMRKLGFSTKCFSKSGNLCCKQVLLPQSFKSSVTQKTFSMTLTVRVNYWYALWNVGSAVSNPLVNQKQNFTLD